MSNNEETLSIIKPDAVERNLIEDIKQEFKKNGFIISKEKKIKIEKSVKELIKEEEKFGIKEYKTYQNFSKKVYKIREKVIQNINKIRKVNKRIIGFGSPAKATTALNFFGISNQIDCIFEDNKLKIGKYIPGANIPIKAKQKVENNSSILVLAWNFFDDIKKNNKSLFNKFISIKDLEN